jgi:4-oxalocrotonate tautomerase
LFIAFLEKTVPFVRVSVPDVFTDTQLAAISESIHTALINEFNVPPGDRFQVITRHPPEALICSPEYLDIKHSDRVAFVQITASEGRTIEMKKALFAAIASSIEKTAAMSAADVIIHLVEVKKENWSFGNGIAQYAT